jgi:hypothetical protein
VRGELLPGTDQKYADGHVLYRRETIHPIGGESW